eukprot:7476630-Karenia_brevis.AAC.1
MENNVRSPPSFLSAASSPFAKSPPPKSSETAMTPGWDVGQSKTVKQQWLEQLAKDEPEEA